MIIEHMYDYSLKTCRENSSHVTALQGSAYANYDLPARCAYDAGVPAAISRNPDTMFDASTYTA